MDDDSRRSTNQPNQPIQQVRADAPTARDSTLELASDVGPMLPVAGYEYGAVIGRGGMGEIVAARDTRIDREVALKRMHDRHPDPTAVRRFLREARIQARLDHPAIVPVHELGTDADGRIFFTMKRIAGVTLAERLGTNAPAGRLLRALVDVCHAMERAHASGVVHRDLKPSNIMLGEYGEVYVLDWGVARLTGDTRDRMTLSVEGDIEPVRDETATGALLGTPGYMAPEQVKGLPATTAADVYAIGAILFELLTGAPLHPRGPEALAHTLSDPQIRPSERRPDLAVPPELDSLCHVALAAEPEARPTVHEVAERLQAYLDGDRDLAQRRALAREHLRMARHALDAGDRAGALGSAGRAVGLDPESGEATELVTRLIIEPPPKLPPAIVERIQRSEQEATRNRMHKAAFAFLSPLSLCLALPVLQIQSWGWLVAFYGALVVTAVVALGTGRRRGQTSVPFLFTSLLVVTVLWSRLAGPMMLTPVMICGCLIALASHPKLIHRRLTLLAWGAVAVALPHVLEVVGLLPATLIVTDHEWFTTSTIFATTRALFPAFIVANAVFVLVVGYYAAHLGRAAAESQRKLQIQVWHLEQLVPVRTSTG